jgi:hypothetical protein
MSFQSYVIERLTAISEALNLISAKAKSIDDLPVQSTLDPSSKIHVSRDGESESLQIQKIVDFIEYLFTLDLSDKEDSLNKVNSVVENLSSDIKFPTVRAMVDWVTNTVQSSPFGGSIIPTSTPTGTGNMFWLATQAGTYTNFGGVVVSSNSLAVISRNASGVFSVSQTPLDITGIPKFMGVATPSTNPGSPSGTVFYAASIPGTYTNFGNVVVGANEIAFIIRSAVGGFSITKTPLDLTGYSKVGENKISPWTAKDYASGDQVNHLGKDWVANAATVAGDVPGASDKWGERLIAYADDVDIDNLYSLISLPITPTYNDGYLIPNYLYPEVNAAYRIAQYQVVSGKEYRLKSQLTTGSGNGAGIYCFYNNINSPTTGGLLLQGANKVKKYDLKITIPAGVTYLMVTEKLSGGDFSSLSEVISTPYLKDYTDDSVAVLKDNFDSLPLEAANSQNGLVLWQYNNATTNAAYRASFFPVKEGKKYRVKGQFTTPNKGDVNIAVYCFYTTTIYTSGISGTLFNQKVEVAFYDVVITAPEGANFIGLNQKIGVDDIVITQVIESGDLDADLKLAQENIEKNTVDINDLFNVIREQLTPSYRDGYVIPNYLWEEEDANYKVAKYPVEIGKKYKLKAEITSKAVAQGTMGAYCWFKELEVPLEGGITVMPQLTTKVYDVILTPPVGAKFLNVSQKKVGDDYSELSELIYSKDIDERLNEISSNIIDCWGDSITWGAAPEDGKYWTSLLQNLLGLKYKVVNCGVGGEGAANIPMRQGAMPMYNSLEFTLPSDTNNVPVGRYDNWFYDGFFKSTYDDQNCSFLLQGEGRDYNTINPCFVDGIECTLSYVSESTSPTKGQYYIRRNTAGTARVIKVGTVVYTNAAKNLNRKASVFFMGTNDGWVDTADLIARYKKMIEFANVGRKYVVIGFYGGTAVTNHSLDKTAFEIMEKQFVKEFGLHYINLRKYAVEHGLSDANISPTAADSTAISLGKCPPSLLADSVHPNAAFSVEIADLVFKTLKQLGV